MKKSLRFLIPLILVVFAVLFWRWKHPTLSDEDQIRQSLDGIASQVSHKNSGGVTSFLSKKFQLDGLKKSDIQKQLTIGMLSYATIEATISPSQIKIDGDTATTTGHYNLGMKQEFNSPVQNYSSEFTLQWKREDGQWKISNADGNKLPPGLTGGY
ncbi:hypothetical protein IAD21_01523 [Abditibacteriota bacterium]|nr:hypothetical protein IAD21_01523 [Abditibacteriota bacterium]